MIPPPDRADRPRRIGGDGQPEVFVADEQSDVEVDLARWGALAEAVLVAEGLRGAAELSVMFVDEESITVLSYGTFITVRINPARRAVA